MTSIKDTGTDTAKNTENNFPYILRDFVRLGFQMQQYV